MKIISIIIIQIILTSVNKYEKFFHFNNLFLYPSRIFVITLISFVTTTSNIFYVEKVALFKTLLTYPINVDTSQSVQLFIITLYIIVFST